jgi:hypothetical protein
VIIRENNLVVDNEGNFIIEKGNKVYRKNRETGIVTEDEYTDKLNGKAAHHPAGHVKFKDWRHWLYKNKPR